ncbi:MAG TPA: DUF4388 domain-containing protein [Thermoanaerobaculia bacterium]|nr:DUF4388 domain-containing protein [Thermoanaerobaculia bacterium]
MPLPGAEPNFQFHGDLAETALPEILHTIDRFQVPGVIEASREGIVKTVHIREGNVVHATSNDRDDSLGNFLLRSGRITAQDFLETMRERERLNRRHGELLIERGVLAPAEIYDAIRKQVEAIVWSLFYWTAGRVSFTIGEFEPEHQVRILLPMRQVILQGIKGAPDAKALVARLGRRDTLFEPSWRTEDLIEAALGRDEVRLLSLVDGKRTLYEVCSEGPFSAADNGKILYAFHVLQLIRRVESVPEPGPQSAESAGTPEGPARAIKIRFRTEGDDFSG